MNYKGFLIAVMLLPGALSLQGQEMSDSKTYKKTFRVGNDAVLEVTNKYGNIHISHSHGDTISVRAEITASSNAEDKLDAMMSDVDVSISMTNETVRAVTSFTKGTTSLFESFKGLTKNLNNFESKLKID